MYRDRNRARKERVSKNGRGGGKNDHIHGLYIDVLCGMNRTAIYHFDGEKNTQISIN